MGSCLRSGDKDLFKKYGSAKRRLFLCIFSICTFLVLFSAFNFFPPGIPTAHAATCSSGTPPSLYDLVETQTAFLALDKTHTAMGQSFNMHYASFLTVNGTIMAYYIKWEAGNKGAVGLATSTDGFTFTDQGTVLRVGPAGSWDDSYATFPGVYYDNGTYYLVYEGSGSGNPQWLGLATSSDGRNFTKYQQTANGDSTPILKNYSSGWESANIGTPSLYKVGSTWYLYYHGYDFQDVRIGVATGTDLTAMTKYASNPIVDVSANGWDSGTVGHRDIVQQNGVYYMVYEGSTDQPYDTARWSSGLARSTDLLHWTKFAQNPILPQTNSTFGNDGPSFLSFGGETWIYYRADGNVTRRARVSNEACGGFQLQWNAQSLPHVIGRIDAAAWSVNTGDDHYQDYMQYGPYTTQLSTGSGNMGQHVAVWKLMADNNTADNAPQVRLEVSDATAGGINLVTKNITRQQWHATNTYEYFTVPFTLDSARAGHQIELRVWWYGTSYIREQTVGIS